MSGESYKKKKMMGMATGFGAAIVIVGAMFKIQHWPGATIALIGGLSVEAVLFILGAFEEPHMPVDWTLAYPELAGAHDMDDEEDEDLAAASQAPVIASGDPVAAKLDQMLLDANIGSDLIESLGTGLRNFSQTTENISSVSDAKLASDEFINNIKGASENVGKLSDSYTRAAEALTDLTDLKGQGTSYAEQLSQMSSNLSELNEVYTKQIATSGESVRLNTEISGNIQELLQSLSDSVEDTKKYKEEVAVLGSNLSKLNTIYGNMLSAMSVSNS